MRDSRHHLTHEPSDAYKPQDGLYSDIDVAEVNLSDMNPEEIRVNWGYIWMAYLNMERANISTWTFYIFAGRA